MFKVCSHFCTVATNVLSIQHCIYTSSCSCHIGTQHSSFQHRTLHRQYHTHATRPSEHQTTQAQTIKTSTTCVMQVGTPLVLQPKQLSSICRIAVVTHQYNITNTNAGKLHHPKVVSTIQLPVYLTTTSHKTTLNTTLATSTTHHLFGNRTPALRSASTTTYVQHTSITEHTSISTFLPTFSQTPQQHDPAGHTIPHSMQPQCATAAFRSAFLLFKNWPTNMDDPPRTRGPQPYQVSHTISTTTIYHLLHDHYILPLCFQHTTFAQHRHASCLQPTSQTLQKPWHTQSSASHVPQYATLQSGLTVYNTVNKHYSSTTSVPCHDNFSGIFPTSYSFMSTTESQHSTRNSSLLHSHHFSLFECTSSTAWRRQHGTRMILGNSKQYFKSTHHQDCISLHTHTQHQHWIPNHRAHKAQSGTTAVLSEQFPLQTMNTWFLRRFGFQPYRCDTRPIALRGDFLHIQSKTTTPREVVLGKNRAQRLDIRLSENLGSKGTSSGMETSCPSGLLCVRNPESKGKAGGPWTHRWHGPTKTHLCRRENVPAKLLLSEMARWPSQKPPMPTCHDMT